MSRLGSIARRAAGSSSQEALALRERFIKEFGPPRWTIIDGQRGRRFDSVVKHLAGGDLPLRLEGLRARAGIRAPRRHPPHPLRHRSRPRAGRGNAQSRDPPCHACARRALTRDESGLRRADREDPCPGADDPRDGRFPCPLPPPAGLPPAGTRGPGTHQRFTYDSALKKSCGAHTRARADLDF